MSNPFSLETDNKRFFTNLASSSLDVIYENDSHQQYSNRIKNMNNQLEKLARKRQQMLFKQSQMDYVFKRQKPSVGLGDFVTAIPKNDKKFRVRALLKEKKESLHDFLNKKKEIYLSKMNINIKKEQTSKIADQIKDQQQTLKARQLYFQNDVQFMHKFIDGIKKQAEEAQSAVQAELKQQQYLLSRLNSLQAEIEKVDNSISKDIQILHSLEKYKQFIQGLYEEKGNPNWKNYFPQSQANHEIVMFMTQGGAELLSNDANNDGLNFIIKYEPSNMIQIFNNSEQANIRQIQKLQDKQDELQTAAMQQRVQQALLAQIKKQNQQKISVLERNYSKKAQQCQRLRQLKKANNNKINVLDNQNLDIDKIRSRVYHLYQQINPKRAQQVQQTKTEGQVKRQMAQIQGEIQKMRQLINEKKQLYPYLIPDIQKQIKTAQKQQNIIKKKQQNERLQRKKQQQQEKKRNQAQAEKPKGRKDMEKVVLRKKQKIEEKTAVQNQDNDEKYFDGEN